MLHSSHGGDGALSSIASLFLGDHLGSGVARDVYEYRPGPDRYVVKVERRDPEDDSVDFQNIAEWELWVNATKALQRWLAPPVAISPDGRVMLQTRCEPCPTHMIPKKVPVVLGDLHNGNFGILNGKVVLMDYGRHLALRMTANAKQMKDLRGGHLKHRS